VAGAHRMTVRVRYPEADPMGRLHHSVHLVYFEMGRTELLRTRGLAYREMEAQGRFIAIADIAIQYRGGAAYDDELVVETQVETVRGARVVFLSRLLRPNGGGDDAVVAEARITGAMIGADGRPQRFSDDERRLLLGE